MHGIENLFVQLVNAVVGVWRGRSTFSQPSLFSDPAEAQRSRFWMTIVAIVVTLFATALAAGIIYLIWWAFTTHERMPG